MEKGFEEVFVSHFLFFTVRFWRFGEFGVLVDCLGGSRGSRTTKEGLL